MNEQDSEIIKAVQETCLNAEGVSRMSPRVSPAVDGTLKGIGLDSPVNGVMMNRDNGKLIFDLYLRVKYGEKIPSLAWNLQQAVAETVKQITNEKVKEVNIHIQGVDI